MFDTSIQQYVALWNCFNIALSSKELMAIKQQQMQSEAAKLKSINLVSYLKKSIMLKERIMKDKE